MCFGAVFRIVLALTVSEEQYACYHICTILRLQPAGENVPEAIHLVSLDYTGQFRVSALALRIPILTS